MKLLSDFILMPPASITKLQHLYEAYAFIDGTAEAKPIAGKAEDKDYNIVHPIWGSYLTRTYEQPFNWYFVVFAPYNKPYALDPKWFDTKSLSACRKLFKSPQQVLLTKEIQATKIHINALVCSSSNLLLKHEKTHCSRYKLHVQKLDTLASRHRVLNYITKESLSRTFNKFQDYIMHVRI